MRLVFLDTETTGLRPGSICQLSYITVDTNVKPQLVEGKNIFFTVDDMEQSAEAIHGFSLEMLYELSDGMYFEDHFEELFNELSKADFIIGHNIKFDLKFLTHEFEGCGEDFKPKNVFCTMAYYKDVCRFKGSKGDIKNPKLEEVVKFFSIDDNKLKSETMKFFGDSNAYHDARYDTTATYLIVVEGIKKGLIKPNYFSGQVK